MTQETRHDLRFPLLAIAVAAGAIGTTLIAAGQSAKEVPWSMGSVGHIGVFALLLLGVTVAELLDVAIPGAGAISMSFPLYIATAVCLGPLHAGAVTLASLVPTIVVRRRSGWAKLLFNSGQLLMTAMLPGVLYLALGGVPLMSRLQQAPIALVIAGITGTVVNLGLGALGVSFLYGESIGSIWRSAIAWMVPSQVVLGFVGLAIGEVVGALGEPGFGLFVLPLLVARQTYQQSIKLRQAYADTISSLVAALEAKDMYTKGHSVRVAEYTVMIAHAMGFTDEHVRRIEQAALLHDVGKVGVSRRVLAKEGRLTDDEYEEIKRHPDIGAHIVADVPYLADLVPIIQYHHQRLDGRGYGGDIKSEQVPLEARILAVADSYDAMTSARPYRGAMTHQAAVKELRDNCGTQFDVRAVEAFELAFEQTLADPVDSVGGAEPDGK